MLSAFTEIYPWQFFRLVDTSGATILDATRDPPKSFREFIEAKPLRGLGESLEDIERLIADDEDAVVQLAELKKGKEGGANNPKGSNQHQKVVTDNNIISDQDLFTEPSKPKRNTTQGTSRAYTLTRLKNEQPELYAKVKAKEISANKAAIEAGWRKVETDVDKAKRAYLKLALSDTVIIAD